MYQIHDLIVVAVAAAGITLVLAAWFYERELANHHCDCDEFDIVEDRIPIGDPAEQKTPGVPDEYLRPLMYAGLFEGSAHLGVRFPWSPEQGDQA